ncbi:MAG: Gfo/Idh/MocA family oxidoreductase [Planctomycetota bacterium]|jgi:predicted dehydrogenase
MTKGNGKLRVAVAGVGHLGSAHARVYSAMEDVELVAVADVDPAAAERVAAETGAEAVSRLDDIPDVDAASVVVPTVAHREVAEHFLARGASVFVEKPLAPDSAEAEALLGAASGSKGILQVGHIERFNPAVRAARPHVSRPRFIECRRVAPFSFRSKDIGVVFDLMIHDLDIIQWLVGEPLVRVDAVGTPVLLAHEDVANARLVFEGGCVADLTASRVAAKAERALRIFQESSYVSIDTMAPRARLFKASEKLARGEVDVSAIAPADLDDPREFLFRELISLQELTLPDERPLQAELRAFVDAVRAGGAPEVSGAEGLAAIRLAERVLKEIAEVS